MVCCVIVGPMYRLEKQMEPNVAVELDSTLESQSTLEFCLVRENSEFGLCTNYRRNKMLIFVDLESCESYHI